MQERQHTHAAATTAAEEAARFALKAQEHAARLREEGRKEREERAAANKLTFSQKVCLHCTSGAVGDSILCKVLT